MWFPSPGTQRSKLFANILCKIWLNYSAENLFPSFKSPEKVLTIDLMPSFAYSVFTLQNCTGTNTAAVGGWNQMRPFLRRLKHNQLHSPYSKVVVNMIPHLNVYVHIGEETFTWVSEAFGKIQRKKKASFQFPQVSFHCVCCDEDGQSWCIIYNAVGNAPEPKGSKL